MDRGIGGGQMGSGGGGDEEGETEGSSAVPDLQERRAPLGMERLGNGPQAWGFCEQRCTRGRSYEIQ